MTPSSSKGAEPTAPTKCGSSTTCISDPNTEVPNESSKKVDFLYKAPPETACTKAPNKPAAIGASNKTGHLRVSSLRACKRDRARSAA